MALASCIEIRQYLLAHPGSRATDIASALGVTSNKIRSHLTWDLKRKIVIRYTRPAESGVIRYKVADRADLLETTAIRDAWRLLDSVGFYVETEGDSDD